MKIFDFKNFKKGDELGSTPISNMGGPSHYDSETNEWVHIDFGPLKIGYRQSAAWESKGKIHQIDPVEYGTEAICFCTGKWQEYDEQVGDQVDVWHWQFVCTPEFFEKNKVYILKHTTRRVLNLPSRDWHIFISGDDEPIETVYSHKTAERAMKDYNENFDSSSHPAHHALPIWEWDYDGEHTGKLSCSDGTEFSPFNRDGTLHKEPA
jgi:hypothetical protein|tara:strand:- start:2752 stop:3375 length:624 start_codon:yes stop_codon:yes gene_type:complete